jgi:hypothetical protein
MESLLPPFRLEQFIDVVEDHATHFEKAFVDVHGNFLLRLVVVDDEKAVLAVVNVLDDAGVADVEWRFGR